LFGAILEKFIVIFEVAFTTNLLALAKSNVTLEPDTASLLSTYTFERTPPPTDIKEYIVLELLKVIVLVPTLATVLELFGARLVDPIDILFILIFPVTALG
jgi:hypothetical protein